MLETRYDEYGNPIPQEDDAFPTPPAPGPGGPVDVPVFQEEAPAPPGGPASPREAPSFGPRPAYAGAMAPDTSWWSDAPEFDFNYKDWTEPDAFVAPTWDKTFEEPAWTGGEFKAPDRASVEADEGYQFRRDQGSRALEQSAAARGVLRSGGTLKDLAGWNQDFASGEYDRVYNRATGEWENKRQVFEADRSSRFQQFASERDAFQTQIANQRQTHAMNRDNLFNSYTSGRDHALGVARTGYEGEMSGWSSEMAHRARMSELAFGREWDVFHDAASAYDNYITEVLRAGA